MLMVHFPCLFLARVIIRDSELACLKKITLSLFFGFLAPYFVCPPMFEVKRLWCSLVTLASKHYQVWLPRDKGPLVWFKYQVIDAGCTFWGTEWGVYPHTCSVWNMLRTEPERGLYHLWLFSLLGPETDLVVCMFCISVGGLYTSCILCWTMLKRTINELWILMQKYLKKLYQKVARWPKWFSFFFVFFFEVSQVTEELWLH